MNDIKGYLVAFVNHPKTPIQDIFYRIYNVPSLTALLQEPDFLEKLHVYECDYSVVPLTSEISIMLK